MDLKVSGLIVKKANFIEEDETFQTDGKKNHLVSITNENPIREGTQVAFSSVAGSLSLLSA